MTTAHALAQLSQWDTPTICNALEMVDPKRRGSGYTVRPLVCLRPEQGPVVGYARTATIRAVTPSPLDPEALKRRRLGYYRYLAAGPGPTITVIQDLDPVPGYGAFWGEVNTAVHQGLGCVAAVTNGSMRDLDACAPQFQLLAGSVGPSHAFVHVVDYGEPVNVHGMAVQHGDIVHADRHGAVVVPAAVAPELPDAVARLGRREAVVLEAARAPGFDADALERAWSEQGDVH